VKASKQRGPADRNVRKLEKFLKKKHDTKPTDRQHTGAGRQAQHNTENLPR